MSKEYYKEIGGYGGVSWKDGGWRRFDCETCGLLFGHLVRGKRRQGPPTKGQARAINTPTVLKWHDPKRHGR
jgi:hypothetical protein